MHVPARRATDDALADSLSSAKSTWSASSPPARLAPNTRGIIASMDPLYHEILDDVRRLVELNARGTRRTIEVSPETAELLDRLTASTPDARAVADTSVEADEPLFSVAAAVTANAAEQSTPSPRTPMDPTECLAALSALKAEVAACTKCGLCKSRTNTVFSDGNPSADVVFVGEAPGADEDRQGTPFVGRAGQLLTDIIVKGMKLERGDVYICNILKCRPPGNRDPQPDEVALCEPYLIRQLDLVQPKVICCLGRIAAHTLLKTTESLGRLRGRWHHYHGIPLRVTYHPAYILRQQGDELIDAKRKTWADIQEVMRVYRGEITP